MTYLRQQITRFFRAFSIYNFLLLVFGLPFLTEGLFLFFRQSFLNDLYHPFYLLLFSSLIFLYGNFFSQIQSNEKVFQNFSLRAAFVSFGYWLLLSPIFFFRFYQMFLAWQPLPAKILSFLFLYRWKIVPIIVFLYLIVLYFLYRSILLPKYLKHGKSLRESRQLSWEKTKKTVAKHVLLFFIIPFTFIVLSFLLKFGFIWAAQFLTRQSSAMIFLMLYRVLQNVIWGYFFLYLTTSDNKPTAGEKMSKGTIAWLSLTVIVCLGLYPLHYAHVFQSDYPDQPLTISHRGVSNRNGVQNSIGVLKKTNEASHPDLVEMDVQETADHQLVVIHDEDLKQLADKNIRIDESTWSELKKVTLNENGYSSKIPLLTDYLAEANRLNQKLLIELKVTAKTKGTILQSLAPLKDQLTNHQLQSMDLDTANQMKQLFPALEVGYILPVDLLGAPKTSLDFMNIEARTANGDLLQALTHRKQKIYVWPVNARQQAAVYRFQNVAGILTDNLQIFPEKQSIIKIKTISSLLFN